MSGATWLVTGGAGFIGSHLCDALLGAGDSVRVLDDLSTGLRGNLDPRSELVTGDVADPACVRAAMRGAAGCFHLAAISSVARGNEDWPGTHRVNAGGTVAVLDAARAESRLPVVYASSAAVYGDLGGEVAGEDSPCKPRTAYGADKLGGELHARAGWLVHSIPSVGLRLFNVYGPRQDPRSAYSGVISIFASRLAAGLPLILHGDGEQTRDFLHVSDAVALLRAAMAYARADGGTKVVNGCTGRAVSVRALADALAAALGTTARLERADARPGDIRHSRGDPALARSTLGVVARVPLEEGIATLLQRRG